MPARAILAGLAALALVAALAFGLDRLTTRRAGRASVAAASSVPRGAFFVDSRAVSDAEYEAFLDDISDGETYVDEAGVVRSRPLPIWRRIKRFLRRVRARSGA
jgi:hypothetical protein